MSSSSKPKSPEFIFNRDPAINEAEQQKYEILLREEKKEKGGEKEKRLKSGNSNKLNQKRIRIGDEIKNKNKVENKVKVIKDPAFPDMNPNYTSIWLENNSKYKIKIGNSMYYAAKDDYDDNMNQVEAMEIHRDHVQNPALLRTIKKLEKQQQKEKERAQQQQQQPAKLSLPMLTDQRRIRSTMNLSNYPCTKTQKQLQQNPNPFLLNVQTDTNIEEIIKSSKNRTINPSKNIKKISKTSNDPTTILTTNPAINPTLNPA